MDNVKIMSVELGEVNKQVEELDGSYNSLAKRLRELRKEWKSTNDESQRNEIGKQMVEINNQLKEMDASVGVFSRNVGNYTNSIIAAFDKVGLGTGNLGKVMNSAFSLATTGANSFKDILTLIAKHPIIFAITAIVAVFMKLKDAISQNEVLSNKMKVAMSALEPIFNAITNAIDFLASKLVDLITWAMSKVPEVIKFSSKVTQTIGNGIAAIVKAVTFLPSVFNKVFSSISETVFKGLTYMGDGIAKFLKGVGLDGVADKLTSTLKTISTTVSKAFEISGNVLESASDKVKEFFATSAKAQTDFANAMQKSQAARQASIDLEQRMRKEQTLTAESEIKQAELREKIAQTSDPAERIKYQKQLRAEIEATGKRQVQLAKEQYEQAKYYASLAPNSKADNEELARLEANYKKTEANYLNMMASVDKQMTRQIDKLANQQKKAQSQSVKDTKTYVKDTNDTLEEIDEEKVLKEWLDKRKKTYELDVKNRKATEANDSAKATMYYTFDYVGVSDKYLSGEITYEEYEQRITELQEQYAEQRLNAQIESDNLQLEELQRYYDEVVAKMGATSDVAIEIEAKLATARAKVDDDSSKLAIYNVDKELKQKKNATAQKEKMQKNELNAYKSFSSGMQSLMGENSKAAKALAISTAIIDTWQGAAAVLKEGPAAYGGGILGTALMYANMAGVIATGMANVKNILSEKQTASNTASTTGGSLSTLSVNPLINEATDTLQMQNTMQQSQSEQKVYILESDITTSNNRVTTREMESTF